MEQFRIKSLVIFLSERQFETLLNQELLFLTSSLVVHGPWGDILLKVLPRFKSVGQKVRDGGLIAPMPGKVIDLKVKVGSKIKKGDTLVILEAMKMEHTVKAAEDGIVDELFIADNDQVENGALLMVIK